MARLSPWILAFILTRAHAVSVGASKESAGVLFVSSPSNGEVSWIQIPAGSDDPTDFGSPQPLVKTGLMHPQGLAFDQKNSRLLVADPDVKHILAYEISYSSSGTPEVKSGPHIVCKGVESRGVSVDGFGDVIFSDEPESMILKVKSADVLGNPEAAPEVIFNGGELPQVSEPGGVAVDNSSIYWTNKHFGSLAGSVIKGTKSGDTAVEGAISVLAKNSEKSFGLCLASGNLFYSDDEKHLFGVHKDQGNPPEEVTNTLQNPRGCVAAEDGRVFLADRGAGAVYSFANPGVATAMTGTAMKKVFSQEDAFGMAFMQKSDLEGFQSSLFGLGDASGQALRGSQGFTKELHDLEAKSSSNSFACQWIGIGACNFMQSSEHLISGHLPLIVVATSAAVLALLGTLGFIWSR